MLQLNVRICRFGLPAVLALCLTVAPAWAANETGAKDSSMAEAKPSAKNASPGEPALHPRVKMSTNRGDFILELNAEKAPITVLNFLRYAKEGYYNGTIFHRVMKNFMIQGGGFTPEMDKKLKGVHDPILNEWRNGLKNKKYTIAMARLPRQPNSATTQFFINVVDNPMLDQPRDGAGYAVFGKVVEGQDVVEKIRNTKVIRHPKYPAPAAVTPKEPVVIQAVSLKGKFDRQQAEKLARQEQAREAKLAQNKEAQIMEAVKKLADGKDVKLIKDPSGLSYAILKKGSGPSPTPRSTVTVNYRGIYPNGEQFDSSYDRGKPSTFMLGRVIPGWTIGLGMMKVGGKRILVCPPELAYGSRPPRGIPANATLIFLVELLEIK